ncbi:MAG: fosmidomycin resistance protein [Deltaproteobacteria bacterium RBG_16_54_18]|nr:MAG: fosmidomycin resistance protein [Deltaproteobacteria bacterium RBG_16_54_18]
MKKEFNLKVLLILSLGHLTVDIYQGALPATLPFIKDKLDLSYALAGLILVAANMASSILQPVFGYLSDRKAMPMLLPMGLLAAGTGFSMIMIPAHFALVLFLVVISGLGVASYHPEGYKTAHFFTGERSATGMSIFSVGGNLGFSLGPILALSLIGYLGAPALPLILVPALVSTVVILAYRRTVAAPLVSHSEAVRKTKTRTTTDAYVALCLVIFIVIMRSWTQLGLMTYIPFYYINVLKGNPLFAGKLVSVFLACGAIGTLLGAPLADRWGYRFFVRLSMFLSTVTLPFFFLPAVQNSILIFFVLGLQGVFLVATFSVTIVMAQKILPHKLGVASGLLVGFAIGTGGMGVTLLGIVADRFGVPAALQSIMIIPLVGFIASLFLREGEEEESSPAGIKR